MKSLLFSTGFLLSWIFFTISCSTKVQIIAPYKSATFVYAVLDSSDTAHYVRIQKSFLSQDVSITSMTHAPDSSFYLNLDVSVKELDQKSNIINVFPLVKVNMANEGYPKDTGMFFKDPSYAYKFTQKLFSKNRYRLVIHNPQTGETDSAETVILSEDSMSVKGFRIPLFFRQDPLILSQTAHVNPDADFFIEGFAPDSSKIMDGVFVMHWVDKDTVTGKETDRSYDWHFGNYTFSSPAFGDLALFSLFIPNSEFVNQYKNAMGKPPANVIRYLDSSDIFIYASTDELYKYGVAFQLDNLGMYANNSHPIFSNFSGKNTYGIFTSKARRSHYNAAFQAFGFNYIVTNLALDSTGVTTVWADH